MNVVYSAGVAFCVRRTRCVAFRLLIFPGLWNFEVSEIIPPTRLLRYDMSVANVTGGSQNEGA